MMTVMQCMRLEWEIIIFIYMITCNECNRSLLKNLANEKIDEEEEIHTN